MDRQKFTAVFREADWLTRERITLWATCFGVAWFLFLLWDAWAHSALGITDAKGEHIGRDFINYWAGARLAAEGRPFIAYDLAGYLAYLQRVAGNATEFKMYSYPPMAMLLTLPLALLPFMAAFLVWSAGGYVLCAKMLSKYITPRLALTAAIAAPACFINLQSGQNGFFTAALLAGGLMLLERRPLVAGLLFGLLCYKPQFGLLLPFALAAGGYWRAFFAAAATTIGMLGLCTKAFDVHIWPAFINQMHEQGALLERGNTLWHRMSTIFCMFRVAGADAAVAGGAQVLSTLAALIAVVKVWRGKAPQGVKNAVLVLAIFLATPYAWDYDMVVILFALLWVIEDAARAGWQPFEKFAWFAVVIMPLPVMGIAKFLPLQPGALVVWWVMWLALKRAKVF